MTRFLLLTHFENDDEQIGIYRSVKDAVNSEIGSKHEYSWLFEECKTAKSSTYFLDHTEDFISEWKRVERENLEHEWRTNRIDWSLEEHLSRAEGPVIRRASVRKAFLQAAE
jgi:hypothetical protein